MRRVLLATLVALVAVGCGDAAAEADPLVPALCEAIAADDVAGAGDVFWDRAHRPLHALAADLQPEDPALTARLLEAKYDVETVVPNEGEPGPAPLVRERLQVLTDRVRAGLAALDRPAPSC